MLRDTEPFFDEAFGLPKALPKIKYIPDEGAGLTALSVVEDAADAAGQVANAGERVPGLLLQVEDLILDILSDLLPG